MNTPSPSLLPDVAALRSLVSRVILDHFDASPRPDSLSLPQPMIEELFDSPEVGQLKTEIIEAGRRLWQRAYVDGNGGNISARITENLILCTPTLCSKGALKAEELSIVDLENHHLFGLRPHTTEVLLHLEIYKAVPEARAVIHCHPPYATAHAMAGIVPQGNLLSEQEIFVGPVALAPYDTPGTPAFARSVVPFARQHNTILLANHGVVSWADSVEHAEWYVEVVETYCKTLLIALQLRGTLPTISPDKIEDLLAIKKRMGLPDARFPVEANEPLTPAVPAAACAPAAATEDALKLESLIDALTLEVVRILKEPQ